jgi:hypothetical protein
MLRCSFENNQPKNYQTVYFLIGTSRFNLIKSADNWCIQVNKLILESHVILNTCFDWFKKLRLFVNERNLRIDVVLKASRTVVIRWFSVNDAPLGLFKFNSHYLPYFEKINIFFNVIAKIYKNWSKLFVRFIRNNLNQVVHTLA